MGFFKKISNVLAPSIKVDHQQVAPPQRINRQAILDSLKKHFVEELTNETTSESLLFHSSYTIYLSESDYNLISPSFHQTCDDAVKVFLKELKTHIPKYPDFTPPTRFWTFHLVNVPSGAIISTDTDTELEESEILIRSSLYPDTVISNNDDNGNRIVATLHSVNSMKAMPVAVNLAALKGLTQLDKDKYQISFDPHGILGFVGASPAMNPPSFTPIATLIAEDGMFWDNGRRFTTFKMTSSSLTISGRNAIASIGQALLKVDSESVMNPHISITKKNDGYFYIVAFGDTQLNGRKLAAGVNNETLLPNNSTIIIYDDIQINFRISK